MQPTLDDLRAMGFVPAGLPYGPGKWHATDPHGRELKIDMDAGRFIYWAERRNGRRPPPGFTPGVSYPLRLLMDRENWFSQQYAAEDEMDAFDSVASKTTVGKPPRRRGGEIAGRGCTKQLGLF